MNSAKLKALLKTALFLAVLALLSYYLNRPSEPSSEQRPQHVEQTDRQEPTINRQEHSSVGFASEQKLKQHYLKHGKEFGNVALEEYLKLAQMLRDQKVGSDIVEHIRADGIVSRYERSTGTFVAFNNDKTIRTCFKPNDGESYFHRQKNKNH